MSVSLVTPTASVPIAFGLSLPEAGAADTARRKKAGIAESVACATQPERALAQMKAAAGVVRGAVLADAADGSNTAWRQVLAQLGLDYAVGIVSRVKVWPPEMKPKPPVRGQGKVGRRCVICALPIARRCR
ncbi:hypothetical protein XthCFBP4691_14200 [Xanthomonas theicola]|uniref:Transposase IS701-like DDE domain-containing protein n=1 Tax=Xanthomonas theicola TaxID=56464 RepID=A0A2S6ZD44_9XANT|nr:hypothetical protein XthCFBP4691_14200 [Xanthomonas theicola]